MENALDARHRSEQQVRQFVADASHELRTPLTTIHGYAQLSLRQRDPRVVPAAMGKVMVEATRMAVAGRGPAVAGPSRRRPAARPQAGRPDPSGAGLGRPMRGSCSPDHHWAAEPAAGTRGRHSRRASACTRSCTNLLSNARRHTPAGTTVTVGLRADDDRSLCRTRRSTTTAPASRRSCNPTSSSDSPAPTLPAPATRAAQDWASPWRSPSPKPTAAPSPSPPAPGDTCFTLALPGVTEPPGHPQSARPPPARRAQVRRRRGL